ncbi:MULTISPECIES: tetratricopeptide repeat protein [Mesorhizobium]|nr:MULTISPECIES: tetratricopeptide repeat protein [Mesorhizobium]
MQNKHVDAERCIKKALSFKKNAEFYANLGLALQQAGNADGAAEAYRESLALDPSSFRICNNLANIYFKLNRYEEAIALYRQAISHQPDYALAYKNLGSILTRMHRYDEAEAALKHALTLDNSFIEAKDMLAEVLIKFERYDEAFPLMRSIGAWGKLQFEKRKIIDWTDLPEIDHACLTQPVPSGVAPAAPWCLIQMPGITPDIERRAGFDFAGHEFSELKQPPLCTPRKPLSRAGKLRIGYLSADFYEHATTHLIAGVLEAHDRSAFEVTLFSYASRHDEMTDRLVQSGLAFVDVSKMSDQVAAQTIFEHKVDVLVDLKGYTTGARLGITALRPAPIIVSWLGYPGTLGHPRLADYIIADQIVAPISHAEHYSERIALMPTCYQPNDRSRPLPPAPTRADVGLPEKGLVFCSFNQILKFNPETFDLWSRLLRSAPDSVLWLLEPKLERIRENIAREFAARDISAERIHFAPFASRADHTARLRLCDLALDTYPYNSHTTASDALWAGVPLLTLSGDIFASRVAGSLLTAHGFPELITHNENEYIELALEIVTNRERLAKLKVDMDRVRSSSPLFDTTRFTQDLEQLYRAIVDDHNTPDDRRGAYVSIQMQM